MKSHKQMLFQDKKKNDYFEGWYYKLLNAQGDVTLSLIPGISKSIEDPHAFIQIINNYNNQTYYIRYPLSSFKAQDNPFMITIDGNVFTEHSISVIINDIVNLEGVIYLGKWTTIDHSVYAPNIMGPFTYIPWMECNHGVMSLRHEITGTLSLDSDTLCFDGGVGYIEKDYGTSFPSRYIWIQSNTPKNKNSLFFSYAKIPFGMFWFDGLICILEIEGKQHRFATYNRGQVTQVSLQDDVLIEIKKGSMRLDLILSNHLSHPLIAPKKGKMNQIIYESLDGTVQASLYDHGILEWSGIFNYVASEISGDF